MIRSRIGAETISHHGSPALKRASISRYSLYGTCAPGICVNSGLWKGNALFQPIWINEGFLIFPIFRNMSSAVISSGCAVQRLRPTRRYFSAPFLVTRAITLCRFPSLGTKISSKTNAWLLIASRLSEKVQSSGKNVKPVSKTWVNAPSTASNELSPGGISFAQKIPEMESFRPWVFSRLEPAGLHTLYPERMIYASFEGVGMQKEKEIAYEKKFEHHTLQSLDRR